MGVNLRDLFPSHDVDPEWYHGKTIAIDGHNTAFRYLTSIRGKDGDVLRTDKGRVQSHILGFLGLVKNFRSMGAEPIVIWDGDIHPRKEATVQGRIEKRKEAMVKAEAALAAGDTFRYKMLLRSTTYLDGQMIEDASRMLESLGVAVMRADYDGERYATAMCHQGIADAVATEDFDALVAGAPYVLRKAGSPNAFLLKLQDLHDQNLSVDDLRRIAILCGTDWHPGVKGFGAKTAVKALQSHELSDLWSESASHETRYHKLIDKSDMTWGEFQDLDDFIAALPKVPTPPKTKPCPDMAMATAQEIGIRTERVMACFC